MKRSKIEWTDSVWNPVTGCTKVSAGCAHCYAERMSKRLAGRIGYPADDPFGVTFHESRLQDPLRWQRPRRVFVCSMGDLFHESIPFVDIDAVFAVMALCPQHTFMVLTKRARRLHEYFTCDRGPYKFELDHTDAEWRVDHAMDTGISLTVESAKIRRLELLGKFPWPLPNVWLGVSAENQEMADQRIPLLLQVPAAVRFVSCEPLLGPISFPSVCRTMVGNCWCGAHVSSVDCSPVDPRPWPLDWVIVGGESGPKARACDIAWIRSIVEQCKAAEVPVFAKQLGENCVGTDRFPSVADGHKFSRKGNDLAEWPEDLRIRQWPEEVER